MGTGGEGGSTISLDQKEVNPLSYYQLKGPVSFDITPEIEVPSAAPRSPGNHIFLKQYSIAATFICYLGAILSHSFSWHSRQETAAMKNTACPPPTLPSA